MAGGITNIDSAMFYADLKSHRVVATRNRHEVTGVSIEPMFAAKAHSKNCNCKKCRMKADSALYSKMGHKADCACKACTMGLGGGRARMKADGPMSEGESPRYGVQSRAFSTKKRQNLAKSGAAMKDGSYPIENGKDVENAKKDYYRTGSSPAVKRHIQKRAKALSVSDPFAQNVKAGGQGSGPRPGSIGWKAQTAQALGESHTDMASEHNDKADDDSSANGAKHENAADAHSAAAGHFYDAARAYDRGAESKGDSNMAKGMTTGAGAYKQSTDLGMKNQHQSVYYNRGDQGGAEGYK